MIPMIKPRAGLDPGQGAMRSESRDCDMKTTSTRGTPRPRGSREKTETPLLAHDHAELDELLAAAFSELRAGKLDQSAESLDFFWARLAMHIRAEHLHLFPGLLRAVETRTQKTRARRSPSLEAARNTIARLQDDHDYFMRELAAAVKKLRNQHQRNATASPDVQEKLMAVSRRLETHNELEESQVYQWTGVLLEAGERVVLNERMQSELGDLPARFGSRLKSSHVVAPQSELPRRTSARKKL